MKKRTISMLIVACMTISMLASINAPALAAAGDLPSTMWISPTEANGIPVRIELNKPGGSSGGCGGGGWPGGGGGGGSSSSTAYNLFLPGDAVASACYFSWDDGLEASDGENTYTSGALPIPAPGETKTFTFTSEGGATAQFDVTVYQGSESVPPVFLEIDESQGTIDAMNNDQDHETTCTGVLYADGKQYAMPKIKGRGNSSWMMARTKKPYNLTLDTKVNLLGIDSAKTKKWSLLANSNERSILRNKLGYDMAHDMGIGLDSSQADVWMNGKYLGTYLITPKYDSFVPKNGFLIENDNYKEDPVEEGGDPSFDLDGLIGQGSAQQYYNYNRITVKKIGDNLLGEETVENLKAAGERIRVYTQEVWDAIRSEDGYNSQGTYYADYIDMRSWAAMYLMQDYIKNYDFCGGSLFFHREGQTDADKLYAGPLWDLDIGFGCPENSPTLGSSLDLLDGTGWFVRNVSDTKTSMYKVVGKHEDFMEEVVRVYNTYHSVFDNAPAHLEEMAQSIRASAEMNDVVTSNEQQPTVRISRQTVKQQGTQYEQVYKVTNSWRDYVDNVKTFATARSAFFRDNLLEAGEEGFPALFQCGANGSVTVYDTQDLSGEGTVNPESAYARNSETGEIDVTGEGQINFKVDLQPGWQIKSVTVEPAENFKNLKGPADTGVENAYRITKVTGPLTVRIETEEIVCEHEFVDGVCIHCGAAAMQATFVCDEGVTVDVHKTQASDSEVFENATSAFPRSSATGEIDITGEGQVNFVVKVADGYKLESITAEPASNYKNFKLPEDTLVPNGYRITKMTGDVTVTIQAEKLDSTCEHDYKAVVTPPTCTAQGFTTYTCTRCGDSYVSDHTAKIPHNYQNGVCSVCGEKLLNVTINCSEGASVTVLETQKADGPKQENAASANPRDGDTGLIDCSGEGQVNFIVVLADGYELESVTVEPAGSYKNLKGPADTGIENGYRVTKVKGDFTITVTARDTYEPLPPWAEFILDEGVSVSVCDAQDPNEAGNFAVDPEIFYTRSFMVNFTVNVAEGYRLERVTVEPTTYYQDLKGPDETKAENCYWVTGMTGAVTVTVKAAKLGDDPCEHDYQAAVTAPTCTEKGYTTWTCSQCGDSYVSDETAALGHDWGEGEITAEPTETKPGVRTYTCSRCGETKTEAIPELSHVHEYKATVTEPTCTEAGYTTYTCKCGDSHVGDEVPALGHAFVNGVCTRCGAADPDYEPPVDKSELDKAISAGDLYDENDYTPESYASLKEALDAAKAVQAREDATQDEVDAAAAAVNDAIGKLEKKPDALDKDALIAAIADAEALDPAEYTEASAKALADGIAAAKEALANAADQAAIDDAVAALKDVVDKLEKKPPFLFDDVKDDTKFYFDPVYWAYYADPQITNGIDETHFGPDNACTRGHVVTFLWRAAGCPEPRSATTPFTDLKPGAFYGKAVAWAVEEGITKGMTDTIFAPDGKCNRGQIVTFLWRATGSEEPKSATTPFTDLKPGAFYEKAVAWAVENNVTKGMTDTTFAPDGVCTRGQVVTFLSRATLA